MQLEQQVCSLPLAQRLKELGVKQESIFFWNDLGRLYVYNSRYAPDYNSDISAFTVAELGEMLQDMTISTFRDKEWVCLWQQGQPIETNAATEADARAKMLVYLLENKLITL